MVLCIPPSHQPALGWGWTLSLKINVMFVFWSAELVLSTVLWWGGSRWQWMQIHWHNRADLVWFKGKDQIWSLSFFSEAWSLVDLNYWKLHCQLACGTPYICETLMPSRHPSNGKDSFFLLRWATNTASSLEGYDCKYAFIQNGCLAIPVWYLLVNGLNAIKNTNLVSMLQLDIWRFRILPAH